MSETGGHITFSTPDEDGLLPPIELVDGSVWSIQASHRHHSTRIQTVFPQWSHVEVLVVRGDPPARWGPYLVGPKLFGNVPVELVDRELARRGIKRWKGPTAND
jgi:hypothetical protein